MFSLFQVAFKKENFMASFYGWGATTSRLEPLDKTLLYRLTSEQRWIGYTPVRWYTIQTKNSKHWRKLDLPLPLFVIALIFVMCEYRAPIHV